MVRESHFKIKAKLHHFIFQNCNNRHIKIKTKFPKFFTSNQKQNNFLELRTSSPAMPSLSFLQSPIALELGTLRLEIVFLIFAWFSYRLLQRGSSAIFYVKKNINHNYSGVLNTRHLINGTIWLMDFMIAWFCY